MANMELITSVTVGSGGVASVTLPATGTIPATYTDLQVLMSVRTAGGGAGDTVRVQFNGSSSNFTVKELSGAGSGTPGSSSRSDGYVGYMNAGGSTSNTFSNASLYIPNYTSSNYKSYSVDKVSEQNGITAYAEFVAGLWSQTAAITSLTFVSAGSFNIVEGSTFYLYGISNVTSTTKATGGIVSSDGTYWYHMFPFSGTFTPTQSITADVLVVAGGGGGSSGGGGAGGLRYYSAQSLTATAYTCTVGGGGAKGSAYGVPGSRGDNSQFGALGVSTGGGGGGGHENLNDALTGGSGGGGASAGAGTSNGAAASPVTSPVQGFAGGGNGGITASPYASGGGGGAGAVGSNASSNTQSGAGGAGSNTYLSFASATSTGVSGYYAGGGGGGMYNSGGSAGAGGAGGGGAGSVNTATATNGTANTGGGGGGGGITGTTGGAGGSGIVIVRYAV